MRIFGVLLRRELTAFFFSVTGYIIVAAVTLLIGLSFVVLITNLGTDPSPMPVTEMFYRTYFFWLIVLLAAPIITMRLFALEKSTGTFETLMTAPVDDFQVVTAKFTAAIIFYIVMWLPMAACLFIVRHFTSQTRCVGHGHHWRNVSGHLSGRLSVPGIGLFCLRHFAQPDGGSHDQFCAGCESVCARVSGRGHSRGSAMAGAGFVVFRLV